MATPILRCNARQTVALPGLTGGQRRDFTTIYPAFAPSSLTISEGVLANP
ncbi:hypothetical protein HNQ50_002907 [Silvimonas terrae]|uniref:Uncharacterized protein n=1 Tax=Silvimonas terrae TaxID=300266 RepID=A0A840RIA1_9NEIS|nr:hypothetical protein [Silvimonas terrae]